MSKISQAVEKAAEALIPYSGATTNRVLQAEVVLKVALPIIRDQVAEELHAAAAGIAPKTQYREGLIDGLERGARIAKGVQA